MRYLLDVNGLLALGHVRHVHHERVMRWFAGLTPAVDMLGTCAITELGFVRVSVRAGLQPDIFAAQQAMAKMKATSQVLIELWADGLGADRLPAYVRKPAELTDGHLLELARVQRARLVTLDVSIPGALLIP